MSEVEIKLKRCYGNDNVTYDVKSNCYIVDYKEVDLNGDEYIHINYKFSEKDNLVDIGIHGFLIDDAFIHLKEFQQIGFLRDYGYFTHDACLGINKFKLIGSSHFIESRQPEFDIVFEYNETKIEVNDLSSLTVLSQGYDQRVDLMDFSKWALRNKDYMDRYIKYYLLKNLSLETGTSRLIDDYYLTNIKVDNVDITN